ncbi:hypothetical protein [Kocuria rosea]|nr:hypothetical protein [Kocuria rosea]VEI49339.1 Uncharacterised protein [Kocuria rosea]
MTYLHRLAALLGVLALALAALRERLASDDPDRGDVPGWAGILNCACRAA